MLKRNGNSTMAETQRKFLIFCITLLTFSLFTENCMELIWEQEGEFNESFFGYSIAALDYNGDNIDDLVVGSYDWNTGGIPSNEYPGKIYFYFGSPNFDTIPELTVNGIQYHNQAALGYYLLNLGDINGDNYEDLGSLRSGDYSVAIIRTYIDIYYGGPDCDTIPDFEHLIYFDDGELYSLNPLGDVNGDGYNDAGYVIKTSETEVNQYYIIYGGEIPEVQYWNTEGSGGAAICGIGNINNDEYDDFLICFKDTENQLKHNVVIYGNTVIDTVLTDTLFNQTGITYLSGGAYAGDFNGDGTDDFIGCWGVENGTELWFGSNNLNENSDVQLNAWSNGNKSFGFGDLNNDGISDIILGNPIWSNHRGKAYFFIGDNYANGSIDLAIPAPAVVGTEFGTSVAVGDFNNDGYDDAAIGAPAEYFGWYSGMVYVYAGNDSLAETTPVGIHNEEIPSLDGIEFNAYPNPFNPETKISFSIPEDSKVGVSIYNIKGQKVKTIVNEVLEKGIHDIVWKSKDDSGKSIASGVYFYKFDINGKTKGLKKMLLLK